MWRTVSAWVCCVVALLAVAPWARARTTPRVPATFVGMNLDDATIQSASLDSELRLMRASGVGTVRFAVNWSQAQPIEGAASDLSAVDRVVSAAARAGLRVLPCVVTAPAWDRTYPNRLFSPPARPAPYAAFVSALVSRYGPAGSFWAAQPAVPRLPIREWQIWNEENGGVTWADDQAQLLPGKRTHWPRPYLALLRAAHDAVKRADPRGKTVIGGLVGDSWKSLGLLYRTDRSAGRFFDVVALHPYTKYPANVQRAIQLNRAVMQRHGDGRKPVVLTEFGWPSSLGHVPLAFGFETTEAGQATRLTRAFKLLAGSRRGLKTEALYWYDWVETDSGGYVFAYSGLRRRRPDGRVVVKPAFDAFRRVVRQLEAG